MVTRLGIIGLSADPAAWATMAHVNPIKEAGPLAEHYKLVAISTSNPESAKASAKFFDLPVDKAYSSAEDISNDPDVDMVVVSVKLPMHKQLALPALHAKKDVFVEWPLGNGLAEAEELAALAKKQGVKTVVGLQGRLQPPIVKAKEIIESGALGRIVSTSIVGSDAALIKLPDKARYFNDPNSGASALSIPVSHGLDSILYALGEELTSLNATFAITHPEVIFVDTKGNTSLTQKRTGADNISIQGTLQSGATLNFQWLLTTDQTPNSYSCIIYGDKASLKLEGPTPSIQVRPPKLFKSEIKKSGNGDPKSIYELPDAATWVEVELPSTKTNHLFGGIGEVYEQVAVGGKGVVDFEEAVKRHKMVEAIARSAKNGTRESYL